MADNFTEVPMKGKKGHNVAAPGTDNIGVIAGRASNVAPTYTEGNLVLLSTDLGGALRVTTSGTQTVTGTVTLDAASLAALETITIGNASIPVTQSGAWSVDISDATMAVTQSGTWTVALDAAALSALEATSTTITGALPAGDNNIGNVDIVSMPAVVIDDTTPVDVAISGGSLAVTGPLTDAQLRATPVPVDVSDTSFNIGNFPATQTVAGTVTANAGTGTFNVDLDSLAGTAIATGAGVTNAGTLRVQLSTESLTALENTTVTGTVELGATSLAALETITVGNASLAVTGPLTDAQLRATPVDVDVNLPVGTGGVLQVEITNGGDVSASTVALDGPTLTALETTTAVQGAAAAITAPWPVRLSDGTAALGTVANPVNVAFNETAGTIADSGLLTTANVAAGASTTFNSTALTTGTPRLLEVTASSSARLRVEVQTFNGTTATPRRVFFIKENDYFQYVPRDIDALSMAAGAGATYRLVVTNMDNLNAADVYASMTWSS